jgi:16S rRNA (cytosine1402-N4)-methyltransferase
MSGHVPVLLEETLTVLDPTPGRSYLDCTAGLGGHALAIARRLGPTGRVILNDADPGNLALAAARLRDELANRCPAVITLHGNFADVARRMAAHDPPLRADVLLADLGFASSQMDDPLRGLSFMREGPLDMRFDPASPITAAELVNTLPEHELARLIREYGEDRNAARIARKLVAARQASPISTTGELAGLVRQATPGPTTGIDPATRTFQALRIAVNDELGSLQALLDSLVRAAAGAPPSFLNPGARVAVISFHSLEDRPVKHAFAELVRAGRAEHLARKPVTASDAERESNPRARSAKLRALRFLD